MSAIRNIKMLMRYSKWANDMMLVAISGLPTEEFVKRRPAALGGMTFTLAHIDIVDQIWRGHLLGKEHGFSSRTSETPGDLETLSYKIQEMDEWYVHYADTMSEALLNEKIKFSFVDGGSGEMTRGDMLIHICNHKTFHRGHLADMFYQSGFNPPSIDLPVYMRDAFRESELG